MQDAFCPTKTVDDLEWQRVQAALAARCGSVMGKRRALALGFGEDEVACRIALGEAREACMLHDEGSPIPLSAGGRELPDIAESISRIHGASVLSPPELRDVGLVLEAAGACRRYLSARKERAPLLYSAYATDPSLDRVAKDVLVVFDNDGTLSDDASPELKALRNEARASRQRIQNRLQDLLARHADIMQDSFITEREGRYVIPLRADAHERFNGLVHGTSASGSTLFVEPLSIIPLGNRLKVTEGELVREEFAICQRLSSLLWENAAGVAACASALSVLDVRAATARVRSERDLVFPELLDEASAELVGARHFLLAESGIDVVPSDLRVRAGHAIVVSGPNAGGKTVALKTVGLCALMLRAGLPVAAAEGTKMGFFARVLTDIGDDQSLSRSLSTFSAHVTNLSQILLATEPRVLVLLDEVATGTDPREGEALAAGVLDSLLLRGGAVMSTTHYEGLKALATTDDRFENASSGFDFEAMLPTFRIAYGIPGRSSALEVATRYGVPKTVIERARSFLSGGARTFEETSVKLDEARRGFEMARDAARAREVELADKVARVSEEIASVRARTHEAIANDAEELRHALAKVREDLKHARRAVKRDKSDALLKTAEDLANLASETVHRVHLSVTARAQGGEDAGSGMGGDLRRGDRVYVGRLRAEAEILEIESGTVRVAAGALKLNVPISDVTRVPAKGESRANPGAAGGRGKAGAAARGRTDDPAIQTSDNTCDVRGMYSDDALGMVAAFLDRCLGSGTSPVFIVHGHGTGALRDSIRRELKESRIVHHFRAGGVGEGGDGVTLAWVG